MAGGPVNGPYDGGGGAGPIAPPRNLHSTTMARRMARPAALYMKSMGNAPQLGSGAGVGAPCRVGSGSQGTRGELRIVVWCAAVDGPGAGVHVASV